MVAKRHRDVQLDCPNLLYLRYRGLGVVSRGSTQEQMMANERQNEQSNSTPRPGRDSEIIERGRTTPDRPVQRPPRSETTSQSDKKE